MSKIKLIDLFSGVGGLSYGFSKDEHFEIVAANEILPDMAKAYELNHPTVKMYCKDIIDFGVKDFQTDFNMNEQDIDLIVGGPPCQAYSTVGKRSKGDSRGSLYHEYYRILKELKPKVFLFENVKGLLSMQKGELLESIVSLFESLGYDVSWKVLDAVNFGAPQKRERVILVGTRLNNPYHFPEPTHCEDSVGFFDSNLKPCLTLSDAISDLPLIKSNEESYEYASEPKNEFQFLMRKNAPVKLADHNSPNNNQKLVKIMELLPEGGSPKDLPEHLRPKSGFGNTYCKLWWDRPCTTITRNLSTPSSSRCIHPRSPRPLTTREGARIQCFPDHYQFFGSRTSRNLQIGNAVPTFLSIALKDSIKHHFAI
jgi:DNA (cytosine-5)-methyltransferase 1